MQNNYINYFTEIEEHYQRRRGTGLLLSTLDWALIETWKQANIPLEAVLRGIDAAFDSYERRPSKTKKINSLAYCSQAVLSAAEDMNEAAVGARRQEPTSAPGLEAVEIAKFFQGNADKLRQAQGLLRHRVPHGDLAAVLERALDLLIEDVKKERFAVAGSPGTRRRKKSADRAISPTRSSERFTSATVGAAPLRMSTAGAAPRLQDSNSITWTDSRARTGTMSTGSGSFAGRTTNMQRSRSTDGPSWNERGHRPPRPEARERLHARWCGRGKERQRSFVCWSCSQSKASRGVVRDRSSARKASSTGDDGGAAAGAGEGASNNPS